MNFLIHSFNLYFAIYTYVFLFINLSFFILAYNTYNSINSNIQIFKFYNSNFKKNNFFLFISSFIGIPPLFGFFNKILIFINLLYLLNYFFIFIFILVNGYLMFFYLQQIRFLQNNFKKTYFFKFNNNHSFIYQIILILQFINCFGFILLPIFLKFNVIYIC